MAQTQDLENNLAFTKKIGEQEVIKDPIGLRVLQIFVQGRGLKNLDQGRDKSDSQVTMKMKWQPDQTTWTEVDHTEVVVDNLNPNYEHHFDIVYNFGQ